MMTQHIPDEAVEAYRNAYNLGYRHPDDSDLDYQSRRIAWGIAAALAIMEPVVGTKARPDHVTSERTTQKITPEVFEKLCQRLCIARGISMRWAADQDIKKAVRDYLAMDAAMKELGL